MAVRYPSADDIVEMKVRGYDSSVIDEAIELSKRREMLEQLKEKIRAAFTREIATRSWPDFASKQLPCPPQPDVSKTPQPRLLPYHAGGACHENG